MNYKAIIEIPKNCDRRIHMRCDRGTETNYGVLWIPKEYKNHECRIR